MNLLRSNKFIDWGTTEASPDSTYSALFDLHVKAFLKMEKGESGADFPSMSHAAYRMNASSQEGKYGEFGKHHKKILKAMETETFKEKIHNFDRKMEL